MRSLRLKRAQQMPTSLFEQMSSQISKRDYTDSLRNRFQKSV